MKTIKKVQEGKANMINKIINTLKSSNTIRIIGKEIRLITKIILYERIW